MKKRILAAVLALALVLAAAMPATAKSTAKSPTLRFDENGEFKILHICDCQDTYPAEEDMFTYINHMLDYYEPDLVVLGGDNTVGPAETKELAIKELVAPYVEHEIPFTLVFGNHDEECGNISKDVLLTYYQKYGGKYCLAYDADPKISGTGAHNLPVLASDSNDIKFNVWMFDTGDYVADENGKVRACSGNTEIFLYPPYQMKCVDALITNFHLPESTLIMLVACLTGREEILEVYKYAVGNEYRFFSFGDATFIV